MGRSYSNRYCSGFAPDSLLTLKEIIFKWLLCRGKNREDFFIFKKMFEGAMELSLKQIVSYRSEILFIVSQVSL